MLIGLTMALGVALFGASFDSFQNLTASYQRLYDDLVFADLTVTGGSSSDVAARLAQEPGVAALATRTVADVPIAVGENVHISRARSGLVHYENLAAADLNHPGRVTS